ncbi:sugar porter family MFS transporter [Salinisphaera sp. Q1T1-3]|uniref:sugar porter family MFS transporter n=1 Tax=Salinisphaera sp. Q1T1-3 TaxID=2321229 RepID=UPI000E70C16A|nr:sugar porter family MFS transporter [Salinisphaera sp. Q1T1-3]RJS94117.1 sugar porter family MFS transporter [Salinisphaera sp. Q1T1-3]
MNRFSNAERPRSGIARRVSNRKNRMTQESAEAPAGLLHGRALIIMVSVIAALGGLLFGYDTGIIGVALLGLSKDFALTDGVKQVVTGAIIFGAIFGVFGTGAISDRIGRRASILIVGLIFTVGSFMSALAPSVEFLIASRFVLGLSAGSATQIIPVYIAEVTPPASRGRLVVMFQFMVVFGILVAYLTGFALGDAWRWMFGLGAIPAVILMVGMLLLPESPRWLVNQKREAAALAVLHRVRGDHEAARSEIAEIKDISARPEGRWRDLFAPWIRPALVAGAGIAMFSQITGNNALLYYAPTILSQAGFGDNASILASIGAIVLVNISTVFGILMVDRIGRRRFLLWMVPGSAVAMAVMAILFTGGMPQSAGLQYLLIACMGIYMALNCSFGVALWLINAEVYPLFVRGKGASVGAFSHWGFDLLVTLTTLTLINSLGTSGAFWLYAIISAIAVVFVIRYIPETKGRSLEQIEADLKAGQFFPRDKSAPAPARTG